MNNKKMNKFYVLKGDDGDFYPLSFITRADKAGEMRKEEFEKNKLDEGEAIVLVEMKEI